MSRYKDIALGELNTLEDLQMGYRSDLELPKNKGVNTILKVFPNKHIVELHFATKLPFSGAVGERHHYESNTKIDPKEVLQNIYDNVDGIVVVDADRFHRYSIRFEKGEAFIWEPILRKVLDILTTVHPEAFYGINVDVSQDTIEQEQEKEYQLQMEAERRHDRY